MHRRSAFQGLLLWIRKDLIGVPRARLGPPAGWLPMTCELRKMTLIHVWPGTRIAV
jgi:hypothetical protein